LWWNCRRENYKDKVNFIDEDSTDLHGKCAFEKFPLSVFDAYRTRSSKGGKAIREKNGNFSDRLNYFMRHSDVDISNVFIKEVPPSQN
jgi:hypothetical protein